MRDLRKLSRKQSGFTIVELLIVIVVIGILATLVLITFAGVQKKARDSQRQTDVNAVAAHLESYYADQGKYPTYANLSSTTWVKANLKGLDPEALVGPKGGTLANAPAPTGDAYNYYPVDATGATGCDNVTANKDCVNYTFGALQEKDNTAFSKKSNN